MSEKSFVSLEVKQCPVCGCIEQTDAVLYRAQRAFDGRTSEQMQQPYRQSGKSCAQILKEYEDFDAAIEEAITWVRNL